MQKNYKPIGDYIRLVDKRNTDLEDLPLVGLSIQKMFIQSIANTIGTNMSTYKIIEKNQFAYSPVTSRNGDKTTIALFTEHDKALISQAYMPFEIIDFNKLNPEYLMMWFRRPEFDRYARFKSHGSARETFDWEELCDTLIPVPSIEKQREIVAEYNAVQRRIELNQQYIQKLEETAQALYRHYFVDGIDKENLPEGWRWGKLGDIAYMKYGKMLDSKLFTETGYPVYSGYGIRGFYSEYMYEEPQILIICRGVSGTGEVKLSPKFSFITNLSIVVEANETIISKLYLYYYLKGEDLSSYDSGSAQSMITINDLRFHDVLIPPLEAQKHYALIISEFIENINNKNNETQKLSEMKDLLLSKMATKEN